MLLLILGILLWGGTHLFITFGAQARARMIEALGKLPYRGLFALCIVGALALIVTGWRGSPHDMLWHPPAVMRHITMALMPFAVILFLSARLPTDIKQFIRHPQLTGVKLWAVAHLLTNGETRAVILFGGMLAWAVIEVITINRREGPRQKPEPVGWGRTAASALIGLVATGVLVWAHVWFAGVPLIPHG